MVIIVYREMVCYICKFNIKKNNNNLSLNLSAVRNIFLVVLHVCLYLELLCDEK